MNELLLQLMVLTVFVEGLAVGRLAGGLSPTPADGRRAAPTSPSLRCLHSTVGMDVGRLRWRCATQSP